MDAQVLCLWGKQTTPSLLTPWRNGGSRGTTPLILTLGATWRWLSRITPWPLYPWENKPITHSIGAGVVNWGDMDALVKIKISCYWDLNLVTHRWLMNILKMLYLRDKAVKKRQTAGVLSSSSSSSCSWSVKRVSCSLILKMNLVPPSLPRSTYIPSSFWFIL